MIELLEYTFFRHALLAGLLASILCGMVGTYIVTRRLVFISGGITHASFGGVGIGLLTGWPPILPAALFAVLSAWGVQWFGHRRDMREDSAIAMFWTLGMSIGVICSFLSPGYATDLTSYLFGSILTVTPLDLALLLLLTLGAGATFLLLLRPLIAISFDAEFAASQRLPVARLEYLMMAFIALTIVACLRIAGIVLVISLLTIPQATANLFTHRYRTMMFLSMALGYAGCLGGLWLSYVYNIPSGASVILFSILLYGLCKSGKAWFVWRKRQ
ncbi:MAG: metal ABC transporter permease [Clostridium sp.]|nr:metal ABC transporter permease [Clostridium sp.]